MGRPRPILATVIAATLLFAGCSSAQSQPSASSASVAPVESATTTAEVTTGEISVDEFLAKVSQAKDAATTYTFEMKTSMSGNSIVGSGKADVSDASKPAMEINMEVSGQDLSMIVVDGDYFMKGLMGDTWVKMPAGLAEQTTGSMPKDPGEWLSTSKKLIKKVEVTGSEQVNGVATTGYRVTMDGAALGELSGSETKATGDLIYEVWLDDQSRVRRTLVDFGSTGVSGSTEMTMDNFNEPVDIKAPESFTEMPS